MEVLWPWVLIALAVLIYGYSLSNGFIWDDGEYVYSNPFVASWTGLRDIWYASKTIQYYPLTFTSFWLEHKLYGGFFPASHHTLNLVLHILNALLLLGLLRKIAPRLAGVTALFFTIHPIQVETVAWITERKNLLGLFFLLLAFHAFLKFQKTNKKTTYTMTLFFFIAALLSKTMSVCFATVPLLYAWYQKGSISKKDWLQSLPLLLTAGIFGFITIYFERTYVGAKEILSITPWERIVFVGKIFFFYLGQILLPWKFMFFYPKWDLHQIGFRDWIPFLSAAGTLLIFLLKRQQWGRGGFTLLCFYAISIFPALGFFDLYPMRFSYVADHFSYFSVPAVLLLFGSAISVFFEKSTVFLSRFRWQASGLFLKCLLTLLIVFLSVLSFRLTLNYKDQKTLWSQLLLQNPTSTAAYTNLASLAKNPDDALLLIKAAVQLEPQDTTLQLSLAQVYEDKGAYAKAIALYQGAAKGWHPYPLMLLYHRIATLYLRQNNFPEAIPWLEKSVALLSHLKYQKQRSIYIQMKRFNFSEEVRLYNDLGTAYFFHNESLRAVEAFEKAIALDPRYLESYDGLGASLMNLKDFKKASDIFQQALELDPKNENARKNLATARTALKVSGKDLALSES